METSTAALDGDGDIKQNYATGRNEGNETGCLKSLNYCMTRKRSWN